MAFPVLYCISAGGATAAYGEATHPGQVLGRGWLQVRRSRFEDSPPTARSDIFATGAILCEMFLNFSPTR